MSLSLALPATAASLAYLNARWGLADDCRTIYLLAKTFVWVARREKKNRVNLFYILEEHVQNPEVADQEFLVYESRSWTFKQVYEMALKYAGWLHKNHNIKLKEVVAVDFMNCPQFLFITLALWSLGATPAFINYNLTGSSLVHCVRVSTTRLLLVDPEVSHNLTAEVKSELSTPAFREDKEPLQIVVLDKARETSLAFFPQYRAPDGDRSGVAGRDTAALIFTSGTTGLPKAAIVSWSKPSIAGSFFGPFVGLRSCTSSRPDRWYTCIPLYHGTAFITGFSVCLISGTTFVLGHRFSTTGFWKDVRSSKATIIHYVGETLRYLTTAPPTTDPTDPDHNLDKEHKVRLAFGNGLRPDIWEKFRDRFGIETIVEFYSATEAPYSSWNVSRNTFATGAVGRTGLIADILFRRRIAIVKVDYVTEQPYRDPQTGYCESVSRSDPGELLFALDPKDIAERFSGYLNNEKATHSKIIRDVFQNGDAWFRIGDLMRRDHEGRLYFHDRLGDTFRWKSENVSTAEVSEVLGHHPRVYEANVYGVEVPGHEGRAGCAAIIFDKDPTDEVLESLATHVGNSLPKYAVPLFLRRVTHMQATGNNKQQKQVLRMEGVDPDRVTERDKLYWLQHGKYVPFEREDWDRLRAGNVRL